MPLTFCQFLNHGEQVLADQLGWFQGKGTKLTSEQLEAYTAGFEYGWQSAYSDLSLHKASIPLPDPILDRIK